MIWMLIAILVLALFMIPLGLPGLWIMIGVVAVGAVMGHIGLTVTVIALAIATIAELIEFFIVKRLTNQYGGSKKAFWGALAGGLAGVIVGGCQDRRGVGDPGADRRGAAALALLSRNVYSAAYVVVIDATGSIVCDGEVAADIGNVDAAR